MAPLVLYHMQLSPPSRGALMVARLLGVDVEVKNVNLLAGEHLNPDFIKLNPLHTVPTLDDNGFVVVDSQVIATYLTAKYGVDDKLYPKDVNKRCVVDQRLQFNSEILFKRLKDISYPIFFQNVDTISEEKKQNVHEALKWLEGYLQPTGWVAGDNITIADILCAATVVSFQAQGFDYSKYPIIQTWLTNCEKNIPDFNTTNKPAVEQLHAALKSKLKPGELQIHLN